MQILGNRVLVKRLVEEVKEGYQTVDVEDSFLNKGLVISEGEINTDSYDFVGKTILFAKYSPDTHDYNGMKIVNIDDILAIL